MQWEQVFGEGFKAVLMFIYWIEHAAARLSRECFNTEIAGICSWASIWPNTATSMRRRSAKWETVALPAAEFRQLARPIENWL